MEREQYLEEYQEEKKAEWDDMTKAFEDTFAEKDTFVSTQLYAIRMTSRSIFILICWTIIACIFIFKIKDIFFVLSTKIY